MFRQFIFPAFFSLLIISCSDPVIQSENNSDTAPVADTLKNNVPQKIVFNPDTFRIIDSVVSDINSKIKNKLLSKKSMDAMDPAGGFVYGYFYPDNSVAFVYSSFGAEAARSERISYYKKDSLLYSVYRLYQFETDAKGICNSRKEHFRAEKIFYLPQSNFSKDSITQFIDKINYQCTADALFPKSQLPEAKEIVQRTGIIKDHLVKYGK